MAETIQNVLDTETGFRKLYKSEGDDRVYDIALNSNNVRDSDTISTFNSAVLTNMGKVTGSLDLVLTGLTNDGALRLQLRIYSGTVGEKYKILYNATMTSGDILEDTVVMEVVE